MSGVEIAGIVLGSIPLVISGLEHYADGIRTIQVLCNASREFKTLARKLKAEEIVYRNTLSVLLNDCIAVEEQATLIQNPAGGGWSNNGVQAALRKRLQCSYDSFMDHVKSIHSSLEDFKGRLYIDNNGKGPFEDAQSFRQAYRRFHFALKKSAYMDLIDSIRDDNTHIHRLTKQSQALLKFSRQRRTPDYDHIRAGAKSVFETLQQGLQVSCGASHKASIYLRPVGAQESGFDIAVREADDTFRIVLHHDGAARPGQKAIPWSVQEAEMRLLDTKPPLPAAPTTISPGASRKRKVQFCVPVASIKKSDAALVQVPQQPQKLDEIHDLCHSIEKMRSMQCGICLGYMMGVTSQHRHGLYWPKDRLLDPTSLTVSTLANVLDQGKSGRKLTNADAHRLAVPLASWMLRLHDTPWLLSSWGKGDITLIQQNGKILTEHAFITQSLKPVTMAGKACLGPQGRIATIVIRNPTLFALGIILIELCTGQTIDELQQASELNPDGTKHAMSDFETADRLLRMEEISDRFGQRWSDVVRRCIYCDLNQSKVSLDDKSFRSAVHNDIVAELEEDYRQFFHL